MALAEGKALGHSRMGRYYEGGRRGTFRRKLRNSIIKNAYVLTCIDSMGKPGIPLLKRKIVTIRCRNRLGF